MSGIAFQFELSHPCFREERCKNTQNPEALKRPFQNPWGKCHPNKTSATSQGVRQKIKIWKTLFPDSSLSIPLLVLLYVPQEEY